MVIAAIDLGEKNIIALTFDKNIRPIIYRCPVLKQLNRKYSKDIVNVYEDINYMRATNRKIEGIKTKQSKRTTHIFNQIVKELYHDLAYHKVDTLVIGRAYKDKKAKTDEQQRFNDTYVNFKIQYNYLISLIRKRASKVGVTVVIVDEAYTSRLSCIDLDDITLEGIQERIFSGRRINRDEYRTSEGLEISSDVNASYNILRRSELSDTIEELLAHYQNIQQVPKPYVKTITERR